VSALLDVAGLDIAIGGRRAVAGASFSMARERLGLVGGSGAGKSLIGRSILRLLPAGATMRAKRLAFDGIDISSADARQMQRLRGRRIGLILQDPKFSLNPLMTIGAQIDEAFRRHHRLSRRAARARTLAMLEAVRFSEPQRVSALYPHEVSGGMGQRAMIAMMLAPEPELLIADEPTSALDPTSALQVLAVLDDLVASRGMGLLFISHDLGLVADLCDRVLVIEAGTIVESCDAAALAQSTHPYTRRLLAARALAP